jgi:hypothetical protein
VTAELAERFRFRLVRLEDVLQRRRFESALVATLAACPGCRPTDDWLGKNCYSGFVRESGMWNRHGIGGTLLQVEDLKLLADLIRLSNPDV